MKRQEKIANESDVQKQERLEKNSLAVTKYRFRQDIDRIQQETLKSELEEENLAQLEGRKIKEERIETAENEQQKNTSQRNTQRVSVDSFNNATNKAMFCD